MSKSSEEREISGGVVTENARSGGCNSPPKSPDAKRRPPPHTWCLIDADQTNCRGKFGKIDVEDEKVKYHHPERVRVYQFDDIYSSEEVSKLNERITSVIFSQLESAKNCLFFYVRPSSSSVGRKKSSENIITSPTQSLLSSIIHRVFENRRDIFKVDPSDDGSPSTEMHISLTQLGYDQNVLENCEHFGFSNQLTGNSDQISTVLEHSNKMIGKFIDSQKKKSGNINDTSTTSSSTTQNNEEDPETEDSTDEDDDLECIPTIIYEIRIPLSYTTKSLRCLLVEVHENHIDCIERIAKREINTTNFRDEKVTSAELEIRHVQTSILSRLSSPEEPHHLYGIFLVVHAFQNVEWGNRVCLELGSKIHSFADERRRLFVDDDDDNENEGEEEEVVAETEDLEGDDIDISLLDEKDNSAFMKLEKAELSEIITSNIPKMLKLIENVRNESIEHMKDKRKMQKQIDQLVTENELQSKKMEELVVTPERRRKKFIMSPVFVSATVGRDTEQQQEEQKEVEEVKRVKEEEEKKEEDTGPGQGWVQKEQLKSVIAKMKEKVVESESRMKDAFEKKMEMFTQLHQQQLEKLENMYQRNSQEMKSRFGDLVVQNSQLTEENEKLKEITLALDSKLLSFEKTRFDDDFDQQEDNEEEEEEIDEGQSPKKFSELMHAPHASSMSYSPALRRRKKKVVKKGKKKKKKIVKRRRKKKKIIDLYSQPRLDYSPQKTIPKKKKKKIKKKKKKVKKRIMIDEVNEQFDDPTDPIHHQQQQQNEKETRYVDFDEHIQRLYYSALERKKHKIKADEPNIDPTGLFLRSKIPHSYLKNVHLSTFKTIPQDRKKSSTTKKSSKNRRNVREERPENRRSSLSPAIRRFSSPSSVFGNSLKLEEPSRHTTPQVGPGTYVGPFSSFSRAGVRREIEDEEFVRGVRKLVKERTGFGSSVKRFPVSGNKTYDIKIQCEPRDD